MWIVDDPTKDKAIIREINRMKDRPAAIIACCYLEQGLEQALRTQLKGDERILNAFFKGMGPLSSFAARIDMAYLLGIVKEEKLHQCLHAIRRIRNHFAHEAMPLDFNSSEIIKASKHLINSKAVALFLLGALKHSAGPLKVALKKFQPILEGFKVADDSLRSRYLGAVQICLLQTKLWEKTRAGAPIVLQFHPASRGRSGKRRSPRSRNGDQSPTTP